MPQTCDNCGKKFIRLKKSIHNIRQAYIIHDEYCQECNEKIAIERSKALKNKILTRRKMRYIELKNKIKVEDKNGN